MKNKWSDWINCLVVLDIMFGINYLIFYFAKVKNALKRAVIEKEKSLCNLRKKETKVIEIVTHKYIVQTPLFIGGGGEGGENPPEGENLKS